MSIYTYYLTGQKFNILERLPSGQLTFSTADADYPGSAICDGRVLRPYKATTNFGTLIVDLNMITNGSMEAGAGNLTGWTEANTGTGDVTRTTTAGEFSTGSAGMKLAAGNATAVAYQDLTARAGERWNLIYKPKSDGTTSLIVRVFNATMGRWLTSGGAWQAAQADAGTYTANTFGSGSLSFTVESLASQSPVGFAPLVTLRFYITCETPTKTVFMDEFYAFPAVDFVGIFGHNHASQQLLSSTDNFSSSTVEATLSPTLPNSYTKLATPTTSRYLKVAWGCFVPGASVAVATILQAGEVVFGQAQTFARGPDAPHMSPHETSADRAQVRIETPAGDAYVFQRSSRERRTWELPYSAGEVETRNFIDEIHHRSENGQYPMVIVPDSSLADVGYVRVESSRSERRTTWIEPSDTWNRQDLIVRELAFPQFAA